MDLHWDVGEEMQDYMIMVDSEGKLQKLVDEFRMVCKGKKLSEQKNKIKKKCLGSEKSDIRFEKLVYSDIWE